MFFNSIEEINRLRNEINSLLGKGMTNVYLDFTTEDKHWGSPNFSFINLKNLLPGQFLRAPTQEDIIELQTSCCNKKSRAWEQKCLWLFYYFNFERNYDVSKSKDSCIFWSKI